MNPLNDQLPVTIAKFIGHIVFHEPAVTINSLGRSIWLVVLAPISVVLDGFALTRYDKFLESKMKISLGCEMLQTSAFLIAPLFLLEAASPNLSLSNYPQTQNWLIVICSITGVAIWAQFFLRTRKVSKS